MGRAVIGKRHVVSGIDDRIRYFERCTQKGAVPGVNAAQATRRTHVHAGAVKLRPGSVIFEIRLCKGDGTCEEDKGGNYPSVFNGSDSSRRYGVRFSGDTLRQCRKALR